MRILANENVTGTVIAGLRGGGHDVLSVKESLRGEKDDAILARAQVEKRIVLTHDKDFGELTSASVCLRIAASFWCGSMAPIPMLTTSEFFASSKVAAIGKVISRSLRKIECACDCCQTRMKSRSRQDPPERHPSITRRHRSGTPAHACMYVGSSGVRM
jgi:hypothetical protein